jgi:glycosyltransferase involved in cell wall biosynthesis
MRVLMFGWEFPPFNSGGLGVACEGLVRALRQNRVDIVFVLPKKLPVDLPFVRFASTGDLPERHVVNSVLTPYITSERYEKEKRGIHDELYGNDIFSEVRRYGKRGGALALQETFDLIHAHDWLSFPAGLEAKRLTGKPLVVHVHATEYDRTGGNRPHQEIVRIEREGMLGADLVVAVSNFVRETIVSRYGIPPEKVYVCHNGIDIPASSSGMLHALKRSGKKIVLFVGRLTLQKGPEYFLRAAKIVLQYEPKALFVISGSGEMERQLIEESAALGLRDRVIFTGFLRGEDLIKVYQMADVFVMPSVSEPFGLTALEAASLKVPLVLSKQSGVKEVLKHSLVIDFWDVRGMAERIVVLLRHPALRETLASQAEGVARNSTWGKAAEALLQTYSVLQ